MMYFTYKHGKREEEEEEEEEEKEEVYILSSEYKYSFVIVVTMQTKGGTQLWQKFICYCEYRFYCIVLCYQERDVTAWGEAELSSTPCLASDSTTIMAVLVVPDTL